MIESLRRAIFRYKFTAVKWLLFSQKRLSFSEIGHIELTGEKG